MMKIWSSLPLVLALISSVTYAIEYPEHDPQRILTVSKNVSGQNVYGLDMRYLDRMLDDLSRHAGHYPPSFDSAEQKRRASQDLNVLLGMLDVLLKDKKLNLQILLRSAIANRMGHNLDIPGSAEKAEQQFQALLQAAPGSPQGNYQFGIFLAATGRLVQSVPYLEKSLAMGVEEANYSLGMAYLGTGNKQAALVRLREYLKIEPNDNSMRELIKTIELEQSGSLKNN